MSDTASDLASGSQDLAALLGLFCTQGVERNALANNFGYGTVVASSLSLLGVLGLVKSSIKLALGLKRCEQAGFNLDSLRGIFGYLEGESPSQGTKLDCMVVKVTVGNKTVRIHKERRWFSGGNTPLVNVGVGPEKLHRNTLVINLGNLWEENRLRKHAAVVILALVVCAGLTRLPLKEILLAAASRTEQDTIPLNVSYYVLKSLDLGRLLRRRWIDTGDDGAHMMVLALYRTTDGEITPFILIDVEYSLVRVPISPLLRFCLAEAQWPPRVSGENVRSPCTLFALKRDSGTCLHLASPPNERLHLASPPNERRSIHDENCPWSNKYPRYLSPNTYKYLGDRSRVCRFLQRIARDSSFDPKFTPGWANAVHISGSNAKPMRRGLEQQPWILDYHNGIQEVREYLSLGFTQEKLRRKRRFPYPRCFWGLYSRVCYHLKKRSTEEALPGDGPNEDAAEMEDISPTASRV
ncbi:MAG: hypothetical protein Q9176_005413 [Flavoplaca citrina]